MNTAFLLLAVLSSSPSSGPVAVPPPVFGPGCTPPADICDTLLDDCLAAGGDPERCEIVATGICPGSPCLAKDAALRDLLAAELDAAELVEHMDKAMTGCSCDLRCTDSDDLSLDMLMAVCFAYPSATGDDCEDPSAGQCMALLTLSEDYCDIDTCEYIDCQRDLLAQGDMCAEPPPSCDAVVACDAAENAAAPAKHSPLDWRTAPVSGERCLRLSEVFVRPTGQVAHRQWVEISNICDDELDLAVTGTVLRWTQPGTGWSGAMSLAGIGVVGPGDCLVVGGPESVPANYLPDFDLPISFSPAIMLDGAGGVSGIGLFTALATVTPFDAVAYGSGSATFNGPDGKPAVSVTPAMPAAHSLSRHGKAWGDAAKPSPGQCQR